MGTVGAYSASRRVFDENMKRHRVNLPDRLRVGQGWFNETLPKYKNEIGPISFLRLDGDIFTSTWDAMVHLYPQESRPPAPTRGRPCACPSASPTSESQAADGTVTGPLRLPPGPYPADVGWSENAPVPARCRILLHLYPGQPSRILPTLRATFYLASS